jgi:hypothetical protein
MYAVGAFLAGFAVTSAGVLTAGFLTRRGFVTAATVSAPDGAMWRREHDRRVELLLQFVEPASQITQIAERWPVLFVEARAEELRRARDLQQVLVARQRIVVLGSGAALMDAAGQLVARSAQIVAGLRLDQPQSMVSPPASEQQHVGDFLKAGRRFLEMETATYFGIGGRKNLRRSVD